MKHQVIVNIKDVFLFLYNIFAVGILALNGTLFSWLTSV